MLRLCLSVALIVFCNGQVDAQLQQISKLDLLQLGRNQKVLACHFKDGMVTVLIRRSTAESKEVAFSLCELGRNGRILSEKVIHQWHPEHGGGMNFAFALATNHQDEESSDIGTLVLGPMTREETGVFQRYSSTGRLQWTESLPGGNFAYCVDIKRSKHGFVIAGVGGSPSTATVRGLDERGRESWHFVGKKRHQASRILVNSNGEIITFTDPIDLSSEDLSMLVLVAADGKKLKEKPLEGFGKISDHRSQALILGTLDFAWLAGPMKKDSFVFAFANKPFPTGTPTELHADIYDSNLEQIRTIDFGKSFERWTYFFDVSKLDDEKLVVSGVSDGKIHCAVVGLDGKLLHTIQITPPEQTLFANVWTDGFGQVAIFLECLEQADTGRVVRAGTLYLLQDKK